MLNEGKYMLGDNDAKESLGVSVADIHSLCYSNPFIKNDYLSMGTTKQEFQSEYCSNKLFPESNPYGVSQTTPLLTTNSFNCVEGVSAILPTGQVQLSGINVADVYTSAFYLTANNITCAGIVGCNTPTDQSQLNVGVNYTATPCLVLNDIVHDRGMNNAFLSCQSNAITHSNTDILTSLFKPVTDNYCAIAMKTNSCLYGDNECWPVDQNKNYVSNLEHYKPESVCLDYLFDINNWVKKTFSYVNSGLIAKEYERPKTPFIFNDGFIGYGEYVGKQGQDLIGLSEQLYALTEQQSWLSDMSSNDIHLSVHESWSIDWATWMEICSKVVQLKITQISKLFEKQFKYVLKLISKGTITRHINKKRVFRTRVNLIFKNLDDAHPNELSYLNPIHAFNLTFKYYNPWKLILIN